jgi:hypothetical protein
MTIHAPSGNIYLTISVNSLFVLFFVYVEWLARGMGSKYKKDKQEDSSYHFKKQV